MNLLLLYAVLYVVDEKPLFHQLKTDFVFNAAVHQVTS